MTRLQKQLAAWSVQGLISHDQASAIDQYENRGGKKSWAVYPLVGLGVFVMAVGVISLVSANWWSIPTAIKLLGYGLIQAGFGFGLMRFDSRPGWCREGFLLAFCLFFFAGIGLIAQIYHLGGHPTRAFFFWCGLTILPAMRSKSRILNYLWAVVLLGSFSYLFQIESKSWGNRHASCQLILVFLVIAALSARSWVAAIGDWMVALRNATLVILFFYGSLFLQMQWSGHFGRSFAEYPMMSFWLLVIAAGVVAVAVEMGLAHRLKETWRRPLALAMVTLVAAILFPMGVKGLDGYVSLLPQLVAAVLFIVVWALLACSAVLAGRSRLYDAITFLIALRFLVIYFEVFGSLAETGVGLVISGAVILGFVWLWLKRGYLTQWFKSRPK